jgi:hypothetical protein
MVKTKRDYAERLLAKFSMKIQSDHFGNERTLSIEGSSVEFYSRREIETYAAMTAALHAADDTNLENIRMEFHSHFFRQIKTGCRHHNCTHDYSNQSNTCSVYSLAALQAYFEDPFLGPPTHSCENILLAFELYEIEISVATSICRLLVMLLTISSSFIITLIDEQLQLPCRLLVILLTISSSFIILLIDEQLRLPCRLLVLYCSRLAVLVLYCSLLSSCDFHVDLYYYTAHQ